jgi:hypothetical protein
VRLTINPVKRGGKRVSRNPIGKPREQVAMGSESERTMNRRNPVTSPLGLEGLPKMGKGKGPTAVFPIGIHPRYKPGGKCGPTVTQNGCQERRNRRASSPGIGWSIREQAVSRKPHVGRIAREANARGKAAGYADAGTTVWKVEERVGVNKL